MVEFLLGIDNLEIEKKIFFTNLYILIINTSIY